MNLTQNEPEADDKLFKDDRDAQGGDSTVQHAKQPRKY